MTEPWNCWPGGVCLPTIVNVGIGFGIAAVIVLIVGGVIGWWLR